MTDSNSHNGLVLDVHAHFGPPGPASTELLAGARKTGEYAGPDVSWSPDLAIEFMDEHGIDMQMLSFPMPLDAEKSRMFNEYGASVVRAYPGRFGLLACIPMGNPDRAVAEIDHALTQLGADGVILVSNYGGHYLGDPRFEPAFEALDKRGATVFIHPVTPAGFELTSCGLPGPLIEFPMDTARTVVNALWAGVFTRHPNLRVVLAHAGGVLPILAPRIADLAPADWVPNPAGGEDAAGITAQLRELYCDTAIAATPASLDPLLQMIPRDHVVFGTDFPAAPIASIKAGLTSLGNSLPLGGNGLAAIGSNAGVLFPSAVDRWQVSAPAPSARQ
jgi:predicted TIM-barrel fold metal-dependent hydrolase